MSRDPVRRTPSRLPRASGRSRGATRIIVGGTLAASGLGWIVLDLRTIGERLSAVEALQRSDHEQTMRDSDRLRQLLGELRLQIQRLEERR